MTATDSALNLFLLSADRLLRCRWDGTDGEQVEILNSALGRRDGARSGARSVLIRKNYTRRP